MRNSSHNLDKVQRGIIFQQIPVNSDIQGLLDQNPVVVAAEHQDPNGPALFPEVTGSLQAIHHRHFNIHDDHIRIEEIDDMKSFHSISRFPYHVDTFSVIQHYFDRTADHWLVINQHHPDWYFQITPNTS